MTARDDIHPDGTPRRLGRYRLLRPISTGGMARVFEGRREGIEGVSPRVAIKVILPAFAEKPGFRDLFVNEARVGALLRHQNLVQIQDFDCDADRYFLVMEFVDGVTLSRTAKLCRRHGIALSVPVIAEIGRQVCDGLSHLHRAVDDAGQPAGLIHRDIKPSNLMLDGEGVVRLLDYGVSRALSSEEREGAVRGTWGYMSPEQAAGGAQGPPADLFSLAAVLYELAALEPLFPETEPDALRQLMAQDEAARRATRLTGVYDALVPVLVRALQRDPDARFSSAARMGRALADLIPSPVAARGELARVEAQVVALGLGSPPVAPSAPRKPRRPRTDPSALPVHAAGARSPGPLARPTAGARVGRVLLVLAAIGVLGFTAWRLLGEPAFPAVPGLLAAEIAADSNYFATPRAPVASEAPAAAEASEVAGGALPVEAPPHEPPAEPALAVADPPSAPAADPVPERAPAPEPAVDAALAELGHGLLTLSATPRARVEVDGAFVRYTPLFRAEVESGARLVTLTADDGRRTTFSVEVPSGGEARRVWDFDQGALVGEDAPVTADARGAGP